MKLFKLIMSVVIGIVILTALVEGVEFLIVVSMSDHSASYLMENQTEYFETRNTPFILTSKAIYTFFAAITAGFIATKLNKSNALTGAISFVVFQIIALVWAGFFSDLKSTGPYWMWLYLIMLIPIGILIGYKIAIRKTKSS